MLISRLDLPPTTLRILGSAELIQIHEESPLIYKYKIKKGYVQNTNHPNGIICMGLAQSTQGAEKLVGKHLEPPFTKIFDSFGTKGAVIIGFENQNIKVKKGDPVILKELRSFRLKKI
jgi:selenocysteine-specific elongation factor